tara:strand:- start:817 stop:2841 length:2025 start_codon:yes stop_codon:yes gene_type:complete
MAEFKKEIAKTDFKPTSYTVQGDAQAGFKKAVADTVGGIAKGIGQGYATGKGEKQVSANETDAEATAYVNEAFKAAPKAQSGYEAHYAEGNTVPSTDAPTAEEVGAMRTDFLSQAELSDKKLTVALKQGRITRKEANDRRIQNRKEFMSNPLSAMFGAQYDNVVGGGGSGAARGAFFGKTAEEKLQDKLREDRAVAKNNEQIAIEKVATSTNRTYEQAATIYYDRVRTEDNVAHLTNLEYLGSIGATDSYQLNEARSRQPMFELETTLDFLRKEFPDGIKEDQRLGFEKTVDATIDAQIRKYRLDDNLTTAGRNKLIEDLEDRRTAFKTNAVDTSYLTAMDAVGKERDAFIKDQKDARFVKLLQDNKLFANLFALSGSRENMLKGMDWMANVNSEAGQLMFAEWGQDGKDLMNWLTDAQKGKILVEGANAIVTGDVSGLSTLSKKAAAESIYAPGFADIVAQSYDKHPEKLQEVLQSLPDLSLDKMAKQKQWQQLAKSRPEVVNMVLEAVAYNAQTIQFGHPQSGGRARTVPKDLEIIEPQSSGQPRRGGGARTWGLNSFGVDMSPQYKAEAIGMYKMAQMFPDFWQDDYETALDYVKSKITLGGGTLTPDEIAAIPPQARTAGRGIAADSGGGKPSGTSRRQDGGRQEDIQPEQKAVSGGDTTVDDVIVDEGA